MSGRIPGNSNPFQYSPYYPERPSSRQSNNPYGSQSQSSQRPPSRSGYVASPSHGLNPYGSQSQSSQRPPSRSGYVASPSDGLNPYGSQSQSSQRPPSRSGYVASPSHGVNPYGSQSQISQRPPSRSGYAAPPSHGLYSGRPQQLQPLSARQNLYGGMPQHPVENYSNRANPGLASGSINPHRAGHPSECTFGKIDLTRRENFLKFQEFITNLDSDSYEKRFSDLPKHAHLPEYFQGVTCIAIFNRNKMVGLTDYDRDDESREKCAHVNMVIKREFQGAGLGRRLMDLRERCLREEGYKYKSGEVLHDNRAQMQRLLKDGWQAVSQDEISVKFMKKI